MSRRRKNMDGYEEIYPEYEEIYPEADHSTAKKPKKKRLSRKKRHMRRIRRIVLAIAVIVVLYLTAVFSNIPFIAKWRTIYIMTAMTTNSHQWLATMFIPHSVIEKAMAEQEEALRNSANMNSTWGDENNITEPGLLLQGVAITDDTEKEEFFEKYWEIDSDSVHQYLEANPALLEDGYNNLHIEDFDMKLGLKTVEGDPILVINAPNNLLIFETDGSSYKGKLAIAKEPSQVDLVKAKRLGSHGDKIVTFCEDNDAILGINASGFKDPNGEGNGGIVNGSLVVDGVEYGSHKNEPAWKFVGLNKENKMYVSNYSSIDVKDFRWGLEFYPGLVIDGVEAVNQGYCMGIQPRTTLGQEKDGSLLMLVIDGRQPGYSLGCSVAECTKIMMRYNCYQGMNLDGGSSAVMYYDGRQITKSSSVSGKGRYMPDAILVNRISEK